MKSSVDAAPPLKTSTGRFGTFGGVFTPNFLTILGIILFLRTGWVVGQAGLIGALIIVVIANSISFLTGLSLSAIATSMNVRAGGNYYIISRTLGLEVGGAIGIPLYFSQAISIAFYIIGFTEAIRILDFVEPIDPRLIATGVALIFLIIAWIGADFAIKIQYVILAILTAALLSFFLGGWNSFVNPHLTASFSGNVSFWLVFAVFFPAVTGIEVGTSMSGDLKNPSRSIPVGTIASIAVTALIYVAAVIWLATHATAEELINNTFVMADIALFPALILLGVWAATLSSALGSILAAPRTLQAIARDNVVPQRLAAQLGSPTEPRMAILISTAIAIAIIWAGDLNFVAPIITLFFLNTYGMTNLVAAIERVVGNPSFRPRFRVHWGASLLGALGCYGAMFLISPPATIAAIIISAGIYFMLERRSMTRTWGDVRNGIWFTIARRALLNLESKRYHSRNWKPNILVFSGQPHNREALVSIADWLSRGQGIVSFFQLLVGDVNKIAGQDMRAIARRQIRTYILERRMTAFAEADIAPDFATGVIMVAQAHGVGGLEPNSILMGWSGHETGRIEQMKLLDTLVSLKKAVLLLNVDPQHRFGEHKVIDVWWRGRSRNADLMLMLAHIISAHHDWRGAHIRLLRVIHNHAGVEATKASLEQLLAEVRVQAEVVVLVTPGQQDVNLTMREHSRRSDLTLLGISRPVPENAAAHAERLNELVSMVGTVLMVHSGNEEELLTPE